jgi:predicted RNase H-like nuclease (RuvC/YqgF family)
MQSQVSELDARILDRTETIQGLEVEVEQWNGDRKTLFNELERLAAIKSAMEFSVDGLAERLEQRSSELRKKTMQVNEVAARLEALSNTVRALGGEGKEKPTSIGIDVSGGTTKSSAIRPIPFVPEASPSIDATIDGPNKIEGPHFKKADLLRLMDTLDKLDDLTQLGLS